MARAALLLALAACLALGAHAQLPATLENSTPPAFLNSLLYVANFTDDVALATGYVGGGNFRCGLRGWCQRAAPVREGLGARCQRCQQLLQQPPTPSRLPPTPHTCLQPDLPV